jgi:hypothetical protein
VSLNFIGRKLQASLRRIDQSTYDNGRWHFPYPHQDKLPDANAYTGENRLDPEVYGYKVEEQYDEEENGKG